MKKQYFLLTMMALLISGTPKVEASDKIIKGQVNTVNNQKEEQVNAKYLAQLDELITKKLEKHYGAQLVKVQKNLHWHKYLSKEMSMSSGVDFFWENQLTNNYDGLIMALRFADRSQQEEAVVPLVSPLDKKKNRSKNEAAIMKAIAEIFHEEIALSQVLPCGKKLSDDSWEDDVTPLGAIKVKNKKYQTLISTYPDLAAAALLVQDVVGKTPFQVLQAGAVIESKRFDDNGKLLAKFKDLQLPMEEVSFVNKASGYYLPFHQVKFKLCNKESFTVKSIDFLLFLQDKNRDFPWAADVMKYEIPGGLNPGECKDVVWDLGYKEASTFAGLAISLENSEKSAFSAIPLNVEINDNIQYVDMKGLEFLEQNPGVVQFKDLYHLNAEFKVLSAAADKSGCKLCKYLEQSCVR